MYEIKNVPIGLIDPNPHRDLKTYPWIERKVEHLMHSIDDVGLWASMIARPHGKRYQLAFGHHRQEAAERLKLKTIPLILRQLTDEQMLQFMGRENGEDYNTDFTVMLNTWEGAIKFLTNSKGKAPGRGIPRPLDVAVVLGWTEIDTSEHRKSEGVRLSDVASACAAAFSLIHEGHQQRDAYDRVTVGAARQIATRAQELVRQTELAGRVNKVDREVTEQYKRHIGRAASQAAEDYREHRVTQRELRGQVDVNAYRYARDNAPKAFPLFSNFGTALVAQIERMLNVDTAAEKLEEVRKALPDITETSDKQVVQKLDLALEQVGGRAETWRKKLIAPDKKLVSIPAGR